MKKILLIQPPQWYPVAPHSAVPILKAQLSKAGYDVRAVDLNVKFYNSILTSASVRKADEDARRQMDVLAAEYENADISALEKNGSIAEKTECLKYLTLKKFYSLHGGETAVTAKKTDYALSVMKTKELFFDPEKLTAAKHTVRLALQILSMPYAPCELDIDNYFANPVMKLTWDSIKYQTADMSTNMFYGFLEEKIRAFSRDGYDTVCISMTDLSQLVPVFTLCSLIKKYMSAKVVLGGNYATQIHEDMQKCTEIFTSYADYLVIGDGETALCRLCDHLDGKCDIGEVPNLMYYSSEAGKVVSTGFSCEHIDMDSLDYPDFSDYDFSEYLAPEPVFPVQLSKGCYWGKCSFCDYAYGQQGYSPKHIGRIINELKYLYDTYGARKFMFVDEAVPPVFYNRLALAIIESGMKIYYYSFARLEDGYTPEVLGNLYDSGARLFLWGYECESLRIMKMMNKGINSENRLKILTDSRNAGIWNNGLFIFGYPTETPDEIRMTMDVIRNNRRVIPSCTLSNFSLKKHSLLKDTVGENGIKSYTENGEFYTVFRDVIDGVSQEDRRSLRRKFQFDFLDENCHSLWAVIFSDFDHLLLYLSEYGCDYVASYKSENRICPEFR